MGIIDRSDYTSMANQIALLVLDGEAPELKIKLQKDAKGTFIGLDVKTIDTLSQQLIAQLIAKRDGLAEGYTIPNTATFKIICKNYKTEIDSVAAMLRGEESPTFFTGLTAMSRGILKFQSQEDASSVIEEIAGRLQGTRDEDNLQESYQRLSDLHDMLVFNKDRFTQVKGYLEMPIAEWEQTQADERSIVVRQEIFDAYTQKVRAYLVEMYKDILESEAKPKSGASA